jgi:hypothetical protein
MYYIKYYKDYLNEWKLLKFICAYEASKFVDLIENQGYTIRFYGYEEELKNNHDYEYYELLRG